MMCSNHVLGGGHVAEVLKDHGYNVTCNDLYDHGYRLDNRVDFLHGIGSWHGSIVSNPPYKYAAEFVEHALDIVPDGRKVAMFLKLSFLEGKGRAALFKKYPPRTVYVSRSRLNCGKNGEFRGTSAVCYCWFVWVKGWSGRPEIVWFN